MSSLAGVCVKLYEDHFSTNYLIEIRQPLIRTTRLMNSHLNLTCRVTLIIYLEKSRCYLDLKKYSSLTVVEGFSRVMCLFTHKQCLVEVNQRLGEITLTN